MTLDSICWESKWSHRAFESIKSVCAWCHKNISLDVLARRMKALGLMGIDLVEAGQWNILKKHGLICTMTPSHPIETGLNDPANHAQCVESVRRAIELTSDARFPNVICFSGNRQPKISDERGMRNCAVAVKKVIGVAERRKVTLCMELLNSKVNHLGYMCDRTEWGADLVRRVGSERFKLLYDIYHMQVHEGDVISTIGAISFGIDGGMILTKSTDSLALRFLVQS